MNNTLTLKERIGIDRTTLSGIYINKIDKKKLIMAKEENSYNLKIEFNPLGDINNPGLLPTWIHITSKNGYPFYSFLYNSNKNININAKPTCTLDLCVDSDYEYGNINNWSLDELKTHAKFSESVLKEFGIYCNILNSTVERIELNCSFVVDQIKSYETVLKYAASGCNYCGITIKPEEGVVSSKPKDYESYELLEIIRENKSNKLKIYNKTHAVSDSKGISLDKMIIRIEWSLNNNKTIRTHLFKGKNNKLYSLIDQDIHDCYDKLVLTPMINVFDKHPKKEERILNRYYEEAKSKNRIWQSLCSKVNEREKDNRKIPILGLTYVYNIIDKQYKKDRIRTRERFEKQTILFAIDHLIHMPEHVDFFVSKLKKLQSGVEREVQVEYLLQGTQKTNS